MQIEGSVALRFTWFDVTSPFQRAAAPGDFSGRMRAGGISRLNSYGIFDIAAHDRAGQPLQLRRDAKIELAIPVPRKLAGKAPKTVGFFGFDQSDGRWVEYGSFDFMPHTLSLEGVLAASFPGAFNLDEPQTTTCVRIKIVDPYINDTGSNGVAGATVTVSGVQSGTSATTDANGFICVFVQQGDTCTVSASGSNGTSNYATPHPVTFTAPNIASGPGDCGDPAKCPLVATVSIDYIVGTGHRDFVSGLQF
jgi:hypothetical protein